MKKIALALLLVASVLAGKAAADFTAVVADGVVGTEDAAYRVRSVTLVCNPLAATNTDGRSCYGVLRNGDSTSDAPLLYFAANATNPTLTLDFTKVNGFVQDQSKVGVLFSSGLYYDEVTGNTAVTIEYLPK
jgi:hypothetical protein